MAELRAWDHVSRIDSQYAGIASSSDWRFDGPTISTAQANSFGVNVTPARAA